MQRIEDQIVIDNAQATMKIQMALNKRLQIIIDPWC